MERKTLDALLTLAGSEPVAVHELANKYWPDCDAYAQIRRDNPWWLVLTKAGPVVIGWRKRVISINWEGTTVRGKMTTDDTTSELDYCHAWTYEKAVEYLSTLQSALRLAAQSVAEPPAEARAEIKRLRDALDSVRQYGSDTLSGRTDGPDDRDWQRAAVLEMTRRARLALEAGTSG